MVQNTTNDWGYFTEKSKDACLGSRNGCYFPRGRLLGGSSAINAMIYIRGNRRDYDYWAELGNPSWDWDSVLEYFIKSEDNQDEQIMEDEKHHGVGGPLKVSSFRSNIQIKNIIAENFFEMGYSHEYDVNGENHLGITVAQVTAYKGARFSSAKAFLLPAMERRNLHIIKNAHVTNLEFNRDGSVGGVTFVIGNSDEKTAYVRNEVILSAGAINTPQILMTSGIGPRDHLETLNIEVVKALAVGENLQDHLMVPYILYLDRQIELTKLDNIDMLYRYNIHRTGPLSNSGASDLTGFFSTVNDPKYPDLQFHTFYAYQNEPMLSRILHLWGYKECIIESILAVNRKNLLIILMVTLLNPKSVGKIELRSQDPFDPPKIYHNYFTEQEDIDTILRGIRIFRNFSNNDYIKMYDAGDVRVNLPACDMLEYDSNCYWECYARHMTSTMYHQVGTAKMGPDDDNEAVVDSELRVRGVKGLRVADASIMPKIISGNTNAPTIMIGEKAADFIKDEYWEI